MRIRRFAPPKKPEAIAIFRVSVGIAAWRS
jgi:hypothetical protein